MAAASRTYSRETFDHPKHKCGEIFYNTAENFNVFCTFCDNEIDFEKFLEHFQQLHLRRNLNEEIPIQESPNVVNNFIEQILIEPKNESELLEECLQTEEGDLGLNIEETPIKDDDHGDDDRDSVVYDEEFLTDHEATDKVGQELEQASLNEKDLSNAEEITNHSEPKKLEKEEEAVHSFPCSECELKYKTARSLRAHKRLKHNPDSGKNTSKPDPGTEPGTKMFECEECGEKFLKQANLKQHKYKHTGIICDICGKPFSQVGNMLMHKVRHTGIKPHKCPDCEYTFYTLKELRAHSVRHTGKVRCICEICGRPCRDRGVLTAHMRRHTGERPATCNVCGKSFYSFHDLNVHSVTHTTDRPFVCETCGSTFQRKKALRIHKLLHSTVKKHICKICGRGFTQSGGLNSHMRTHNAAIQKETTNKKMPKEMPTTMAEIATIMPAEYETIDDGGTMTTTTVLVIETGF